MTDNGRIMSPIFKRAAVKAGLGSKSMREMIKSGECEYICSQMATDFVVREYTEVDTCDKKI